jgi:hypothetical protein
VEKGNITQISKGKVKRRIRSRYPPVFEIGREQGIKERQQSCVGEENITHLRKGYVVKRNRSSNPLLL